MNTLSDSNSNAPAASGQQPLKAFEGLNVGIVTSNDGIEKILARAFENRGGIVEVFNNGQAMVRAGKDKYFAILVVSEDVLYNGIDYLIKEIRVNRWIDVGVLWFIGRKPTRNTDGFTKRPFRPVELLKPLYEKLKEKGLVKKKEEATPQPVENSGPQGDPALVPPLSPVAHGGASSAAVPSAKPHDTLLKPVNEPDGQPYKPKKLLVIDDEEGLRELTSMILRQEGYEVVTAANGEEGLKVVGENSDLAAIIVDLRMPVMNGFQFLSILRSLGAASHIPKIMMTSFTQKSTLEKGRKLQINAWLNKPCPTETIVQTIERVLSSDASV